MHSDLKKAFFAAALAALAVPAFSQTAPTTAAPVIQQRKENQQDRIANSVQSGQLTAGETANLEKKESALNKEENRMKKRDDGNLTAADKTRLRPVFFVPQRSVSTGKMVCHYLRFGFARELNSELSFTSAARKSEIS